MERWLSYNLKNKNIIGGDSMNKTFWLVIVSVASYMSMFFIGYMGYVLGKKKRKAPRWFRSYGYRSTKESIIGMDEFTDKIVALVEEAKKNNKKISITEDRNGYIVLCKDLITEEEWSVTQIEHI